MGKSTKIPVSFRFTEDEQGLLERVAEERFAGNRTKAVVEGLKLLDSQDEPSDEAFLAMLEKRLKVTRPKKGKRG